MTQLESRIPEIKAAGAQLAFIAAEKHDGVWRPGKFLEKHPIDSVFLLDEDRSVTKAYGLHNALSPIAVNIAFPATLVIDRGGMVRFIYRGAGQHDRAPTDEVLRAVAEIRGGNPGPDSR